MGVLSGLLHLATPGGPKTKGRFYERDSLLARCPNYGATSESALPVHRRWKPHCVQNMQPDTKQH
jgi:hypothetical protein